MAEKAPARTRSSASAKQQVLETLGEAIEGSANFKSLTSLQQLLSEQGRKAGQEK